MDILAFFDKITIGDFDQNPLERRNPRNGYNIEYTKNSPSQGGPAQIWTIFSSKSTIILATVIPLCVRGIETSEG